jgi:hypothetical protein
LHPFSANEGSKSIILREMNLISVAQVEISTLKARMPQ